MLIADKLEEIVKIQVEAIRDLKIDFRVTVWDSGQTGDGKSSTANFISGLMKSIPPLNDLFELAGMSLPEYLGTEKASGTPAGRRARYRYTGIPA